MSSPHSLLPRRTLAAIASVAMLATGAAYAGTSGSNAPDSFGNRTVSAHWNIAAGHLDSMSIQDKVNHLSVQVTAPFTLVMADGSKLGIDNMRLLSPPSEAALKVDPGAARLAARLPGKAVQASFGDAGGQFRVDWRLVQRKGSHYLREIVTVTALKHDQKLSRVELMGVTAPGAEVVGSVKGSPVVAGHDYFGFEQPLSQNQVRGDKVRLWIDRNLPLRKGQSVTYSAVAGVTHANQLRRDFLAYIERERAHPYRTFLTYNSWYDIGYFTPYTQKQALDRINAFGEQLVRKRGVKLDSYLFDDGWDDRSGSWNFSKDFPDGFTPLRKAAAKYGAAPGVWLSPWGGYGPPKKERVKNGKAAGYEIVNGGLALSGPKYYQRFHHVVMQLVTRYGVNQFKFDGTGNADSVVPGSRFDSDFAAAIALIKDVRKARPNVFINLTTGTYPSPFWLRYADSIWRDGWDHSFTGVGTPRERWITYRDEQVYQNIVIKGPLFPLNSLMLHGLIYAKYAKGLNTDPGHDFANEVHDYFGTGTDLQEMYITPSLLSDADWNTLAAAARWSRANAQVLKDTHWIGGDPGRLDVYGWASWTPAKAIITLRNPDDKPQIAVVDLQRQLQLPPGASRRFHAHDVWDTGGAGVPKQLDADHATTIRLAPFEVLTLELKPIKN